MTAAAATTEGTRVLALGRGLLPAQREYRVTSARTMAQDIWMMRAVRIAGLDQVDIPGNAAKDPAAFHTFLTTLVSRVFEADVVGDLLAGVLVPVQEERWTKGEALRTKQLLLDLTDEDEKQALLRVLTEVIQLFLSSGRNA